MGLFRLYIKMFEGTSDVQIGCLCVEVLGMKVRVEGD